MDSGTLVGFITASKNSLKRQAEIEGSDTLEFESYLAEWNNS